MDFKKNVIKVTVYVIKTLLCSRLMIFFLCLFLFVQAVESQTYLYKRIMIVKNGQKEKVNDDAHYLTFNDKGCYESDKNGFSNISKFIKFTKNENGLHCYYGEGYYGRASYYFSQDYSRLNIKMGNVIYVYQRDSVNKITASFRKPKSNINSTIVPYVANPENNGDSRRTKSMTLHKEKCTFCSGTGVNPVPVYSPNYSGKSNSVYCSYCKEIKDAHHHDKCPSCGGNGYIEKYY